MPDGRSDGLINIAGHTTAATETSAQLITAGDAYIGRSLTVIIAHERVYAYDPLFKRFIVLPLDVIFI